MNFKKLLMIALFSFGLVNSAFAKENTISIYTLGKAVQGYDYYQEQNYEKAFPLLKEAAEGGDMVSQALLGKMYHNGWGVTKNIKKAAYWYQKAAEQGDNSSKFLLGIIYYKNYLGGKPDFKKALYWFQKVDGEFKKDAQLVLAAMYINGMGVKKDHKKARQYLELACDNGHQGACKSLEN